MGAREPRKNGKTVGVSFSCSLAFVLPHQVMHTFLPYFKLFSLSFFFYHSLLFYAMLPPFSLSSFSLLLFLFLCLHSHSFTSLTPILSSYTSSSYTLNIILHTLITYPHLTPSSYTPISHPHLISSSHILILLLYPHSHAYLIHILSLSYTSYSNSISKKNK